MGLGAHLVGYGVVRLDADAAEETAENDFETGVFAGASGRKVRGNNAEQRTQLKDIPRFTPKDGQGRAFASERVAFARDGLDERGFAAPIGPENSDVLVSAYGQGQAVEDKLVAAHHRYVLKVQERGQAVS